jgi:hypothetical protein
MNYPDSSDPKPYRIKFEHRPQYLYAHVSGEHDSVKISISYWRDIADECRRTETAKVLVDEDIAEAVSKLETYKIANEISKIGFTNVLVAFVDRYLEHQEANQFGELVASNRGLRVKVFNDTETAEKWLLEN